MRDKPEIETARQRLAQSYNAQCSRKGANPAEDMYEGLDALTLAAQLDALNYVLGEPSLLEASLAQLQQQQNSEELERANAQV